MNVLAIDPGPHVGIATFDTEIVFDKEGEPQNFHAFESTPYNFYAQIQEWIRWADVVVIEGFYISGQRGKSSNETIEMIGVVKFLAGNADVPVVEQTPADSVSFAGNDKLKALGWWTKGSDHARSATKHLLLYLVRNRVIQPEALLSSDAEGGAA